MDLNILHQRFLVTGGSSGFGRAVCEALLQEGAKVVLNARRIELLNDLKSDYPSHLELIGGDIYLEETREKLLAFIQQGPLHGAFINAGGPPAMSFLESSMDAWDNAYASVLRWKIALVKDILPLMQEQKYGRLLFLESVSVKQPVPSLVLSNSLRMAVVGMVKTLSDEVGAMGITANVLAPGYHSTAAVARVFQKLSETTTKPVDEVIESLVKSIPVQRMGTADELASLALWLLSPASAYITGQTISVDGGRVRGSFG